MHTDARRAHLLRGPMLVIRDEINPGSGDLASAADSFRIAAEMTAPDDPQYAARQQNLASIQRLVDRSQ